LPETFAAQHDSSCEPETRPRRSVGRPHSSTSLREVGEVLLRRRRLAGAVVGGLLLLCILYCLIAPNQYEASARVALRTGPASALSLEASESPVSASMSSAQMQLETLANVFRSDQLAWRVITDLKLYQEPGFMGRFPCRFPCRLPQFRSAAPDAEAKDWLLERFQRRLHVQSLPRTLLLQIRFRTKDAALSAAVVNGLIRAYGQQESESRVQATIEASGWLESQLKELKARVEQDRQRLTAFQNQHGLLSTPETLANGKPGETQHSSTLLEIDELGRQLVAASSERIVREAEYRAAAQGDPEVVIASDPHLQAESGSFATALLEQIHARRSELEQEQARLSTEHGPNFPRVVEIRRLQEDLDRQKQAEDAKLVDRFKSAWQTAVDREQLVRESLGERTGFSIMRSPHFYNSLTNCFKQCNLLVTSSAVAFQSESRYSPALLVGE
jgi:uncharacterized protein involved in exopolysaccharide biosynthesis